jgi:hypothetical protein
MQHKKFNTKEVKEVKESKMIKYKLIMIDHDDTSVDSTPKINYPSYLHFCNA